MPEVPGPGPDRNDPHREIGTSWGHATSGESARETVIQAAEGAQAPEPKKREPQAPPVMPELSDETKAILETPVEPPTRPDPDRPSGRMIRLNDREEQTDAERWDTEPPESD